MSCSCYDDLAERGFFYQTTDEVELRRLLDNERTSFYCGFDPTGASLHVGHLLPIMAARRLQAAGHRPIMLVGGATALIGDPSGKSEARPILTRDEVAANADSIGRQIARFVEFGSGGAMLVDNSEWLSGVSYLDMLRDVGSHFSVSRMLSMDSVKLRLEGGGISFLEFNYMVLQAYDFLILHRRHKCRLQIGGQDQWGNIVSGVELARRVDRAEVFGATFPLLMDSSGQKFGKTAGGAVWLDPARSSVFDYYQFWRNAADSDVGRLLKLFTFLPVDEIVRLSSLTPPYVNRAKEILAYEATSLAHGPGEAAKAYLAAGTKFGFADVDGLIPTSSAVADVDSKDATADLPTFEVSRPRAADGLRLAELIAECGLAKSNGEARRLIQGGGVHVGEEKAVAPDTRLGLDAFHDGQLILKVGKKHVRRITLKD